MTAAFIGLLSIPVNFDYAEFAILTGLSGIGSGLFGAPNRTAIMNSVPANQRGSASGMAGTLHAGLTANGVPQQAAAAVAQTPPVGSLFAAFLGYNPVQSLLALTGVLPHLSAANVATLTGKQFFPELISAPFHDGLVVVLVVVAVMSLIAAVASVLRGPSTCTRNCPPTAP